MTHKEKHITVGLTVSFERIANLLCSAIEGGSNYWYMIERKQEPTAWTFDERPVYATAEEAEKNINTHYLHYYPLNEGGALYITDANADEPELKEPVRLDMQAIRKGLQAWADDAMKEDSDKTRTAHPCHIGDFIKENEDATTADVFLQYCIFGKVIYG